MATASIAETGDTKINLGEFIDEQGLTEELLKNNPNRKGKHPFALYHERVRKLAGVPNKPETRRMSSIICGEVARLPFVPDAKEEIDALDLAGNPTGRMTTEFDQQIIKIAAYAERELNSNAVWTVAARKITREALKLRQGDPDGDVGRRTGGQQGAWVNDPNEDETDE